MNSTPQMFIDYVKHIDKSYMKLIKELIKIVYLYVCVLVCVHVHTSGTYTRKIFFFKSQQ